MRLRNKALLLVAASAMATAGCQEPQDMSPILPPGIQDTKVPEYKPGEGPQALGEQGLTTTTVKQNKVAVTTANSPPTPIGQSTKTASGLVYETLKEGTGAAAKSGDTVTIRYKGTLTDGSTFDSGEITTAIGSSAVIKGWDEGVPGMKIGESRKLTIPPDLGYGDRAQSKIPANSTLIFEVELLGVK